MPTIARGTCSVFFAFDVGRTIDLDAAEGRLKAAATREILRHRRRNPPWFQYRPLPLRVTSTAVPVEGLTFKTDKTIEVTLYDFGALSLAYTIPLEGPLDELLAMSIELNDNERLEKEARGHVREVIDVVGQSITRLRLHDLVESYTVFNVQALAEKVALGELVEGLGPRLAQILRSERVPLSSQEVDDALASQVAFGSDDLAIIDWNGALLFDAEPEDTLSLLEFANVQLAEMRFLDNQLDDALEKAYGILSRESWRRSLLTGGAAADIRKVALLQADTAVMFESVTNALKLVGDAFLARFFEAVSARFHLADWHANVTRKLSLLDSIYTKLDDRQTTVRMEVLEWIIIVLIAVSIVLPFLTAGSK